MACVESSQGESLSEVGTSTKWKWFFLASIDDVLQELRNVNDNIFRSFEVIGINRRSYVLIRGTRDGVPDGNDCEKGLVNRDPRTLVRLSWDVFLLAGNPRLTWRAIYRLMWKLRPMGERCWKRIGWQMSTFEVTMEQPFVWPLRIYDEAPMSGVKQAIYFLINSGIPY